METCWSAWTPSRNVLWAPSRNLYGSPQVLKTAYGSFPEIFMEAQMIMEMFLKTFMEMIGFHKRFQKQFQICFHKTNVYGKMRQKS